MYVCNATHAHVQPRAARGLECPHRGRGPGWGGRSSPRRPEGLLLLLGGQDPHHEARQVRWVHLLRVPVRVGGEVGSVLGRRQLAWGALMDEREESVRRGGIDLASVAVLSDKVEGGGESHYCPLQLRVFQPSGSVAYVSIVIVGDEGKTLVAVLPSRDFFLRVPWRGPYLPRSQHVFPRRWRNLWTVFRSVSYRWVPPFKPWQETSFASPRANLMPGRASSSGSSI